MLCPCSFAALREVLPRSEKCDKAGFLMSAVHYIKELQVICQYATHIHLEQAHARVYLSSKQLCCCAAASLTQAGMCLLHA